MEPTQPVKIPLEVFTSEQITTDAKLLYGAIITPNDHDKRVQLTEPYFPRVAGLVKELEIAGFVKVVPGKKESQVAPLVAIDGQHMHYDAKNNRVVADDE